MTPKERAAMQQALEALVHYGTAYLHHEVLYSEAITALREVLAEQVEQGSINLDKAILNDPLYLQGYDSGYQKGKTEGVFAVLGEQEEPVAWMYEYQPFGSSMGWFWSCTQYIENTKPTHDCDVRYVTPLYAAPVRTKDLTDDEIYPLYNEPTSDREAIEFARAVIAADREKNK